jgi:hypothetical protein
MQLKEVRRDRKWWKEKQWKEVEREENGERRRRR